jgi:PTS system N-acetylglucosamine-specific IIC component
MLANLQKLGRALMLPVAVLPVAGILLRLGQADVWTWFLSDKSWWLVHVVPFIGASADTIFGHLGILFAVGVAVGFARENNGAAGLAGLVCYMIATAGASAAIQPPPDVLADVADKLKPLAEAHFRDEAVKRFGVLCGILSGVIAGGLYNRFYNIKLPEYLAFFGGRRFVPIVSGFAGLGLGAAFGWGWPFLAKGFDALSHAVVGAGSWGLFVYGALNRLLLVTGLHHVLNNVAWFVVGDYNGKTGDLNRFFAGDPTAGAFMSGFFPVMMFGLPAACFAMYRAAPKPRRKEVGGMLTSMALTSFLTGVTEPIEFTFMFLAPALYGIHVVLTGLAMVIMHLLHVRLGFSFSAGLFDYLLNYNKGQNAWMLIPVGIVYALVYYVVFSVAIRWLNLKTPGRDDAPVATPAPRTVGARGDGIDDMILALGGAANLTMVDACTTRLRLEVVDSSAVNEAALKALGARGLIRPSATTVQVVLGPVADQTAGEIRERLAEGGAVASVAIAVATPAPTVASPMAAADSATVAGLLKALGGVANLNSVEARGGRVRVEVADDGAVDEASLDANSRGVARPAAKIIHLILGPNAGGIASALATAR